MDLPKKDATQLAQTYASSSDMENVAIGTTYEVKRDLGRRHINMIAIAGMIVSGNILQTLTCLYTYAHNFRVLDYSWHPARQSPPQDQWALSSDTYVWV
jgi:hypothetical protein